MLSLLLNDLSEKLTAIKPVNNEKSKQIREKISLIIKTDQREQLVKRLIASLSEACNLNINDRTKKMILLTQKNFL